ncbi:MAG: FAD-binding protein [Betaproteobacteria bacterium]|jgi:D-lactate dehydrogenase (cytochrome)|nr:FAD-binding protein [Betaproteobacteria bacterium]MBK7744715.1 FAD-binding protein [Betaproteobacteria bacterium]MBK9677222.1 FAD-binding protein [Betaproteobacteria bacterium]MBL0290560.1 FAD-binding protein [Betaproteobacteria bacterium]
MPPTLSARGVRPDARALADVVTRLTQDYGERAATTRAIRDQHSHGEGMADAALPDVVVFPQSNDEVAAIVRLCHAARVPVIPFGVGTSLEGHVAALYGGVCLDLSQMTQVLEVNAADLDCRVQAGVTREQLDAELKGTGLFFPIDPGANATLGGMAATRASGTNAVRYGTMRENVLGLTVVTAEGRVIRTGGRARKSSAGYDLTRLIVGAEGTLGVITEIQLRLYGVPEAISAAVCQFADLEGAVDAVILAMQHGIPVARIELLDDVQMDACIRYSKLDEFAVLPTLFFEFHGSAAAVAEQAGQMQAIAAAHGGSAFRWATRPEDRNRLWKARHAAYYAGMALLPGRQGFATDACVPISRLADCIVETKADIAITGLTAPIVGHVGDGNFHLVILFDPTDPAERAAAEGLAHRVSLRAIRMGGTCTGEHGIGTHKLDVLALEHGDAVETMRTIKRALDPHNIMNPGKTVPL